MLVPVRFILAATVVAISWLPVVLAQDRDEPPPLKASQLLPAAVVKGPHHQVAEEVRTDGYFHVFSISSTFGKFEAVGRTELAVRVQEIGALATLADVSKTEVFLKAAGQSVVKIGQGAAAVVTDPTGTAKNLGAGVKRAGVNLGRRTQRAVSSATSDKADTPEQSGGNAAASAAASVTGVTATMRQWARKVGVDPYTTNAVLRKALEDIARVDTAGALVTKIAVPIPAPVGAVASLGDIVWSKDPEEVRKINERSLRSIGVADDVAKRLFGNGSFTLTSQTRLAAALAKANVKGVADYVRSAAAASTAREALFFVESAEMLQQSHTRKPVAAILTDSRAMVASDAAGAVRLLLPLDWISWSTETETAISEIGARARRELRATQMEVALTGRMSDLARREVQKQGWTVTTSPPAR